MPLVTERSPLLPRQPVNGSTPSPPPDESLRVQRDLLTGRRKGPGDLKPALLTEVEAQLAGGTQPLRVIGPERRARDPVADRTEIVLSEEAALT